MRIWLEASLIARGGSGGSRRYAERLADGLWALREDILMITDGPDSALRVPSRSLRIGTRISHASWTLTRRPLITSLVGGPAPDLVHAAESITIPPVPSRVTLAVTVHDTWCIRHRCGGRLGFLVRRAWATRGGWDLVLTGTSASKSDLVNLGISEAAIAVTPYGVEAAFLVPPENPQSVRSRLGLDPDAPYLLFVGPVSHKKGGDLLLSAYGILRRRHKGLVLVVRGPSKVEGLATRPDSLGGSGIRFLAPVSDADLAALYAGAAVVVCPSRTEGYNFPLVEALSVGANVVATDIPIHREVSQGIGMFIPPESIDALVDGIDTALATPSPATGFTPPRWEDTARQTAAAYRGTRRRG